MIYKNQIIISDEKISCEIIEKIVKCLAKAKEWLIEHRSEWQRNGEERQALVFQRESK